MTHGGTEMRKALVSAIGRALDGLRYGSVEITVHDGRVTLIERREKVRVTEDRARAGDGHARIDDEVEPGGEAPIGPPKGRRGRDVNHDEEDPTGLPEVPLTERARDATRNLGRDSGTRVDVGTRNGHGGLGGAGDGAGTPSAAAGSAPSGAPRGRAGA
jgi:hypothetical protein